MKTLLSKQEQLKSDIKDKQNEVEQANKKLEEAKEEEQNQYDAMKLRIQYLYETVRIIPSGLPFWSPMDFPIC